MSARSPFRHRVSAETETIVLEIVRKHGPITTKAIAEQVGMKHRSLFQIMRNLAETGEILSRPGTGKEKLWSCAS